MVYIEGALRSEAEHSILLNILTDVAGVQEVVVQLEIGRPAWERQDRLKGEETQDVLPGTIPNRNPTNPTAAQTILCWLMRKASLTNPENPAVPPHCKDSKGLLLLPARSHSEDARDTDLGGHGSNPIVATAAPL